jgi:serine/threonine protein kinase
MFMEYIPAGDLMEVINKFDKLDVEKTRFYFSQVVVCFEYMHSMNMIYRDLKPENLLVTQDGYIKLADFGFLK